MKNFQYKVRLTTSFFFFLRKQYFRRIFFNLQENDKYEESMNNKNNLYFKI